MIKNALLNDLQHLFKIPVNAHVLHQGFSAFVQARDVPRARICQTSVFIVFMRCELTDIKLAAFLVKGILGKNIQTKRSVLVFE